MSNAPGTVRVLCFGDVVGRPGRDGLKSLLPPLKKEFGAHGVVVNGENAAGGLGLDPGTAEEILGAGADVITLGDHTWNKKDLREYLTRKSARCIRPANYPEGAPGEGYAIFKTAEGISVGVMNLIGRVFFSFSLDCPFRRADQILAGPLSGCPIVICDVHAEATSEKVALGHYLNGRVSVVFGTHTHVQTSDDRILDKGTAYITDLGMCGPRDGIIGMDKDVALRRFLTGLPESYQVSPGPVSLRGICVEIDAATGRARSIERIDRIAG